MPHCAGVPSWVGSPFAALVRRHCSRKCPGWAGPETAPVRPCVCCSHSFLAPPGSKADRPSRLALAQVLSRKPRKAPFRPQECAGESKQVCVRDAKRETSTRTSPSKGRLTLTPWRGTGLDIGPAHHFATSAFTWDVGIYDPRFCGRTLQRERLTLSSMCFCVKQRYHCFQQIPWGLNE